MPLCLPKCSKTMMHHCQVITARSSNMLHKAHHYLTAKILNLCKQLTWSIQNSKATLQGSLQQLGSRAARFFHETRPLCWALCPPRAAPSHGRVIPPSPVSTGWKLPPPSKQSWRTSSSNPSKPSSEDLGHTKPRPQTVPPAPTRPQGSHVEASLPHQDRKAHRGGA